MSTLTGTRTLARFQLRRDRVWLTVWLVGIGLLVFSSAASVEGLYPTDASLAAAAQVVENNAVILAFNGPPVALDTLGGRIVFELGAFTYVVVALMNMFLVGRHTRAEEESGRSELVRSSVVGRDATAAATLMMAVGANVVTGLLTAGSLLALGLDVAGSAAFGAAVATVGFTFAGVAAVAVQVTEHARTAYGLTGLVMGVAYVLRAVGDVGGGTLTWLSPIGWGQSIRPFGGERWWVLVLPLATSVLLLVVASRLNARRDEGAGLIQPSPGPRRASTLLHHAPGLALRLQRASLLAWAAGLLLAGIAYGAIARDIEDFVGDNEAMADLIAQAAGDLTDAFFATAMLMLALIACGFAISAALRPRREEADGRAEVVLATAVPRTTFVASHLLVAAAGSIVLALAGGLGTGVAHAVATGDPGEIPRLAAAGLVPVPAMWVLVGLTVALYGLVPRLALGAWAGLAVATVVTFFGDLFDLPQWLRNVSPFTHVPLVPATGVEVVPLAVLTAVAGALVAAGLVGVQRRDIGAT